MQNVERTAFSNLYLIFNSTDILCLPAACEPPPCQYMHHTYLQNIRPRILQPNTSTNVKLQTKYIDPICVCVYNILQTYPRPMPTHIFYSTQTSRCVALTNNPPAHRTQTSRSLLYVTTPNHSQHHSLEPANNNQPPSYRRKPNSYHPANTPERSFSVCALQVLYRNDENDDTMRARELSLYSTCVSLRFFVVTAHYSSLKALYVPRRTCLRF